MHHFFATHLYLMETLGRICIGLAWIATIIGAVVGGGFALMAFIGASGAPQQAAAAGMGAVCAIVPYVVLRAFIIMWRFPDL